MEDNENENPAPRLLAREVLSITADEAVLVAMSQGRRIIFTVPRTTAVNRALDRLGMGQTAWVEVAA